jgi:hypothetical protein
MMGEVFVIVLLLILMAGSISKLRRDHSLEIYAIWYVFSLLFLIFLALDTISERTGKEITNLFGEPYAGAMKFVYNSLTNVEDELMLVSTFVYLAVAPQILAYILSGLSGSATPPRWVRQIGTIAIWSLLKFLAALSGILLARPAYNLFFGKHVTVSDFTQGIACLLIAFMLAVAHRDYFERELEYEVFPGFRVHIYIPILFRLHELFTAYSREPAIAPDAEATPEPQVQVNMPGFILSLRGPVPLIVRDFLTVHRGPEM